MNMYIRNNILTLKHPDTGIRPLVNKYECSDYGKGAFLTLNY